MNKYGQSWALSILVAVLFIVMGVSVYNSITDHAVNLKTNTVVQSVDGDDQSISITQVVESQDHEHEANETDRDLVETIDLNTDKIKTLQPGGCGKVLSFMSSGGKYTIPLNNISIINTYIVKSGAPKISIYVNEQPFSWEIIGNDGLAKIEKLVNNICF